ncbi:hypothetical protein Scep_012765 [Stephania cephalantha]|uniref:Uncharacterized protein n=1 Tax=Stephania cephalantha TaxID=152367 RepID=A0AAP0P6S4_9MAGN
MTDQREASSDRREAMSDRREGYSSRRRWRSRRWDKTANVGEKRAAAGGEAIRGAQRGRRRRHVGQPQEVTSRFQRPAGYGPRRADGRSSRRGREMEAEERRREEKRRRHVGQPPESPQRSNDRRDTGHGGVTTRGLMEIAAET